MAERHRMLTDNVNIGLAEVGFSYVSSVGVLVHTGTLSPEGKPAFLFVERVDHPEDCGWGIPAGRTEMFDKSPRHTGIRELRQETGLVVRAQSLVPFAMVDKIKDPNVIRAVYSYECEIGRLLDLGRFFRREGILITSANKPVSDEIRRLAIIPRSKLFLSGSKVIGNYIKWDVMHWIKARLEGLRVI